MGRSFPKRNLLLGTAGAAWAISARAISGMKEEKRERKRGKGGAPKSRGIIFDIREGISSYAAVGYGAQKRKRDKCVLSHILLEKKTKGTQNPILLLPFFIKKGGTVEGRRRPCKKEEEMGSLLRSQLFLLPKVPPFVKLYTLCFFLNATLDCS